MSQREGNYRLQIVRVLPLLAYTVGLVTAQLRVDLVAVGLLAVICLTVTRLTRLKLAYVMVALLIGLAVGELRLESLTSSQLKQQLGSDLELTLVLKEHPESGSGGDSLRVLSEVVSGDATGEKLLLKLDQQQAPKWRFEVGMIVQVSGYLRALKPTENYLKNNAVSGVMQAEELVLSGRSRGGISGMVDRVRSGAERALSSGIGKEQAALLRGMVLGQDQFLNQTQLDGFRSTGLAHILAASGQNIALLAALTLPILAFLKVPPKLQMLLLIVLILLYVPLAGGGPSIQRAGVMGMVTVVGLILGRATLGWYLLLLAAAATLTLNPLSIYDIGWQLSFAAVTAIFLLQKPLMRLAERMRVPHSLACVFTLTLAAGIGTAPLIAHHFQQVTPISIPVNLVASPVVGPITWLGMLSAVFGQLIPPLAVFFNTLASYPVAFLEAVVLYAQLIPGANYSVDNFSWGMVVACYSGVILVLLLPALRGFTRSYRCMVAATVAVTAAALITPLIAEKVGGTKAKPLAAGYYFLPVGQGDAILITDSHYNVLVDTGPPDGQLLKQLQKLAVKRVDLLVLTHGQADHYGQAAELIKAFDVAWLLDGAHDHGSPAKEEILNAAKRRRVRQTTAVAGQRIRLGEIKLELLWPQVYSPVGGSDPNDHAIVINATIRGLDALLTADAEAKITTQLPVKPVEILKIAHHGSTDPQLTQLLELTGARVAVTQVGAENSYGHPHPTTVHALKQAAVISLRTDRDGLIWIKPQSSGFKIGNEAKFWPKAGKD